MGSIFGRIWRLIKGWLLIGVEKAEDPEVILTEAQDAMRRELEKAKESAVTAIAARNQLLGLMKQQEATLANLDAKARAALKGGDEELAKQLLVEKGTYQQNLTSLQAQLDQANQSAESVKSAIKNMEGQVRARAAQKLALVAGWKTAKIQEQLNKALSGISIDGHVETFNRAEEQINAMQAKAAARLELGDASNFSVKMAKLENSMASSAADEEIEKMKAEMGMPTSRGAALELDEDPLAKLKADLNGNATPQVQKVGQGSIEV